MRALLLGSLLAIGISAGVTAQTTTSLTREAFPEQVLQQAARLRTAWADRVAQGFAPAPATEPSITAGKILTPSIDVTKAPGVPAFQVTFASGTIGAAEVFVQLARLNSGNSYQSGFTVARYPAEPASKTVKFQVGYPFDNLYLAPGTFSIIGLYIISNDGEFIGYGGSQIATLFPTTTFEVANSGVSDSTPPTVAGGKILTPTVGLSSPSPTFAARLSVADNLSGVNSASVNIQNSAGQGVFGAGSSIAYPVMKGLVTVYNTVPSNTPVGTYTISGAYICDVAANCFNISTAADLQKLFGKTSFQITD